MILNAKTFGDGPDTLVILHGLFGMLDNWQTLARRWADRYRVVLLDLRNHGRSPHATEMDYPLMAADVAESLEAAGIDRCHLLGHSMGGKVAMQTALTYPGLVDKLIVVDIAPRQYRPGHDDVFAALAALDPTEVTDRKDAAARLSVHISDPGIQLFLLKNLARDPAGGFRWRMNLPAIRAAYPALIGPVGQPGEWRTAPTLFIRGGKSGYVTDEDEPLIRELFRDVRIATVAEAGHWVHAEQPAALMALVDDFLAA